MQRSLWISPGVSNTRIAVALAAFAFLIGGALLYATLGSRFIFYYAKPYANLGWWVFIALLPAFGAAFLRKRARTELRLRYPTWWVRWMLMFPLSVAVASGAVVIAPLGWLAALTFATGAPIGPIPGRLSSVSKFSTSGKGWGCDQRGELIVASRGASICLEGLTNLPAKGDVPVLITARHSSLGLLISSISPQ